MKITDYYYVKQKKRTQTNYSANSSEILFAPSCEHRVLSERKQHQHITISFDFYTLINGLFFYIYLNYDFVIVFMNY